MIVAQQPKETESIRAVYMQPELAARLEKYAASQNLSTSAAIRDLVQRYMAGGAKVKRSRRSRRMTLWISPTAWLAMKKHAERNKITVTDLVEHSLNEQI